ncbi:hypothetical protein PGN35_016385 [Nodosilinea sp. PGN35]|uniref:hypothetical protein n=1 Tax=Nodosilinea sp. PGN35 TaxID=3020489 RepID=UPI0023B3009A|nr:hypothetical protein [Nodosilinea sp. TSF1-S3]MDF0366214.1 hypothetical protein [Nodosilinea sp. TSF1-S3]
MTTQIAQTRETVAVFNSRQEASQAKQAVQASGLSDRQISIDDHVSPGIQVLAQGTTTGGQAGFWMGLFLGGIVGLIATIIAAAWLTGGSPHSAFSRFVVIGSAIAGSIFGAAVGKGLRATQPASQKMQDNPNAPRQFRLMVAGSRDEIRRAQQALGQPAVNS